MREFPLEETDSKRTAFVLVSGPAFRRLTSTSHVSSNLRLVDVYPLVCWLLGIHTPGRHDGNLDSWREYLEQPPSAKELALFQDFASGRVKPVNNLQVPEITTETLVVKKNIFFLSPFISAGKFV